MFSQYTGETLEGCGLEAHARRSGEQGFHLASSILHTIPSCRYEKDYFSFIAKHMPQLAGSRFKNQLPLKDFSWNATNKTQRLTISGEKDIGKATPQNHMEIQHFLSYHFSLPIIFISLPQSALSGDRTVNRGAIPQIIFLSHHACKSPKLSPWNPHTHFWKHQLEWSICHPEISPFSQ